MKVSFYRNITWLIGILVAVEILLKVGLQHGLILLIADLIVVLILAFLFHQMRSSSYNETAQSLVNNSSDSTFKNESEWQKRHDQWWRNHQHLMNNSTPKQPTVTRHQLSTPGSAVSLSQLERSNRKLKSQIDYLNRKILILRNQQDRQKKSYQNTSWYQEIVRMKKQIKQLKSEYK